MNNDWLWIFADRRLFELQVKVPESGSLILRVALDCLANLSVFMKNKKQSKKSIFYILEGLLDPSMHSAI